MIVLGRVGRVIRAELAYSLVLAVVAVGMGVVAVTPHHWLRGVLVVGAGFGVATVLRLVLTDRRAGLLAIRGRLFDLACYAGVTALLVILAVLVPR